MAVAGPGDCPDLATLCDHIGACTRCALSETRTRVVFGSGDPHARVMLVGEAPGRTEDLRGEPFVGAAGRLLDAALEHAGLRRDELYIANVVKCRPPGNRDPRPEEIATCAPFLERQIELVAPAVLVALGAFASSRLLDTSEPITALRGVPHRRLGRVVVPVFHPAAAIYDPAKRPAILDDMALVARLAAGQAA